VEPERVDGEVIGHIEAVLWRCRRQDDTLGPQAALDTVLAQRNLVRGLLPAAPNEHQDRLLSLYAGLSALLGWLSFDLSNYAVASDYYETARAAAHEAHNTELGAHILCNMSQIATWRSQARIGIDHAVAALGWAMQTDDLPLQAYAHDVAARAYAADGNQRAALGAIGQARSVLARADARQPTLAYFYSPGELANSESSCHLQLGDPDAAERAAEFAVRAIDPSFVRNLAIATLRLGACRLRLERPDVAGAAQAIGDAAKLAAHNRSVRVMGELRRNWQMLESWQDAPEVQGVRERMLAYGLL
jgi:tetratricopeptide (TPR) repeat protein